MPRVSTTLGQSPRRAVGSLLAALLVTLAASTAHASPTDAEVRGARELFANAENDEDAARWGDALEKLRRVAQVKLTAGVRYHTAMCEEHLGQLATALDEYTSAEGQARSENAQDVLSLVGKRIADLGPRVPRLTIRVVPASADAVVTLDGARVPAAILGTAIPLDPGEHLIEAKAADRATTATSVTLRERDVTSIDVKLGEPTPGPVPRRLETPSAPPPRPPPEPIPPPAQPPVAPSSAAGASSRSGAILATAGAGVLATGGIVAFVLAGKAHSTAVDQCSTMVTSASDACNSLKNTVRELDFVAAGAWIAAAAVGTFAVVLWAQPSSPRVSTQLLLGPGSIGLGGRF
jgi:hypothetical protein